VRSGFVAFNLLAHVFRPLPRTQRALMRVATRLPPRPGSLATELRQFDPERTMSVSELNQIISAFVIVCGVLTAVVMVM